MPTKDKINQCKKSLRKIIESFADNSIPKFAELCDIKSQETIAAYLRGSRRLPVTPTVKICNYCEKNGLKIKPQDINPYWDEIFQN